MSSQQLEVVLVDGPGSSGAAGDSSGQSLLDGRTPGPRDRSPVTGPSRQSQSARDTATINASDTLGDSGLAASTNELRRAFNDLYASVTKTSGVMRGADVGGAHAGDAKSPTQELVTGPSPPAWTGKAPLVKAPPVAGPKAPSVKAPPITGPGPQPAVVGPAAGVGTAASAMALLDVAAGPLAIAFATITAAVAAGGVAVKRFTDGMNAEAERLSGLSGPLSAALAGSDLRETLADIRRANRVGPQLAEFETLRGKAAEKLADVNTEIMKVMLDFITKFTPQIEYAIGLIDVVAAGIPAIITGVESGVVSLNAFATREERMAAAFASTKAMVGLQTKILDLAEKDRADKIDGKDPFMDAFLANFPGGDAPAGRGARAVRAARIADAAERAAP